DRAQPFRTVQVGRIPSRAIGDRRAVTAGRRDRARRAESDGRDVIGVGDLLDRALNEQAAVVIASGAAEDDEIAIAVNVVGNPQGGLELLRVGRTVVAVGDIVFRINAARLPARVVAQGVGNGCGRGVVIIVGVGFIVPTQAGVYRPMLVGLPFVLEIEPD